MTERQAINYLSDMQKAALDARLFIAGIERSGFDGDLRTQYAVAFCLFIIGSGATHLRGKFPEFVEDHPDLPWDDMFGLADRLLQIAFDQKFLDIWAMTQDLVPGLLSQIEAVRHWQAQGE